MRVRTLGLLGALCSVAALGCGKTASSSSHDAGTSSGGSGVVDGGACMTDNDCPGPAYCAGTSCGTPGTCAPLPSLNICPSSVSWVCGCDGHTYPNDCSAEANGARVASSGACSGSILGALGGDGGFSLGGDGGLLGGRGGGDAGPPVTCGGLTCDTRELCCGATQSCYTRSCTDCCDADAPMCTSTADCSAGEYCAGSGCGTSGLCEGIPTRCAADVAPVCGCNGITYMNECAAQAAGVRVAAAVACSEVDGGFTIDAGPPPDAGMSSGGPCTSATDCDSTEYCQAASCGAGGTCQQRPNPASCTQFMLVCGCDGQTYESPCGAESNGIGIASMGACPTADAGSDAG